MSLPKSIGVLSVNAFPAVKVTLFSEASQDKLELVRFAAVPPPPFIPVIEPVPSS